MKLVKHVFNKLASLVNPDFRVKAAFKAACRLILTQ